MKRIWDYSWNILGYTDDPQEATLEQKRGKSDTTRTFPLYEIQTRENSEEISTADSVQLNAASTKKTLENCSRRGKSDITRFWSFEHDGGIFKTHENQSNGINEEFERMLELSAKFAASIKLSPVDTKPMNVYALVSMEKWEQNLNGSPEEKMTSILYIGICEDLKARMAKHVVLGKFNEKFGMLVILREITEEEAVFAEFSLYELEPAFSLVNFANAGFGPNNADFRRGRKEVRIQEKRFLIFAQNFYIFMGEDNVVYDYNNIGIMVRKCVFCGFKCGRVDSMSRHMTTHNPNIDQSRVCKCDFCEFTCGRADNMKRHMATHKPNIDQSSKHKCNICEEMYSRSDVLKKHKKKVHGVE